MGTFFTKTRLRLFLFAVGATSIVILGLTFAFQTWLNFHANGLSENGRTDDLGQAGEYLNLIYGVPVAFMGAAVAVVIAVLGYLFTTQQNEIEILRFVEEKTLLANEKYLALRGVLERFMLTGNGIRRQLNKLAHVQMSKSATEEEKARAQADYDAAVEGLLESFRHIVTSPDGVDFDPAKASLTQVAARIQSDSYTAYFVREQKAASEGALAYLRQQLPEEYVEEVKNATSSDLYDVVNSVSFYASNMTKDDIKKAYLFTPLSTSTVDLLGAAIVIFSLRAEAGVTDVQGRAIRGYRINLGAAYILEIIELLPDCESIVSAFNKIFGHRSDVASKFLKEAGPDRQRLASRFWLESFEPQFANLNRLIIVDLENAPNEYYDPERHGALKIMPRAQEARSQ